MSFSRHTLSICMNTKTLRVDGLHLDISTYISEYVPLIINLTDAMVQGLHLALLFNWLSATQRPSIII